MKSGRYTEMPNSENTSVHKSVGKYMELSDEECERLLAESREKMQWDINSIKRGAREEGRKEVRLAIARAALAQNIPLETIAIITGLLPDKIQTLP
jgi:hypothetical protein